MSFLFIGEAVADSVSLVSGSFQVGKILSMDREVLYLQTDIQEKPLKISREKIVDLNVDSPVRLKIYEKGEKTGFLIKTKSGYHFGSRLQSEKVHLRDVLYLEPLVANESVLAGGKPDPGKWQHDFLLGFRLYSGNVEQTVLSLELNTKRYDSNSEFVAQLDGAYGYLSGQRSVQQLLFSSYFNRNITSRLYYSLETGLFHDAIQDLEVRLSQQLGLGYRLVMTSKVIWSIMGGGGVTEEKFQNIGFRFYPNAVGSMALRVRIGPKFFWSNRVDVIPNLEDKNDLRIVAESSLQLQATSHILIVVGLRNRFDNQPDAFRQKNDLGLKTSIGYRF